MNENPQVPIQNFNNLPSEIRNSKRFFKVGTDKVPFTKDWSKPDNQRFYRDVIRSGDDIAGFDTSGHDEYDDFLFLDFDHVLDDDGNFVTAEAEACYNNLVKEFRDIYVERSISGTGLHAFLVPNPENFAPTANGRNGVLYFSDDRSKSAPKLELFYRTGGRYCLVTGNLFRDSGDKIPGVVGSGKDVDEYFQSLLDQIQTQIADDKAKHEAETKDASEDLFAATHNLERTENPVSDGNHHVDDEAEADNYNDPPEYERARVLAMLNAIDVPRLTDTDWLAVISAAKNLGVDYSTVDAFNLRDPDRYDEKENKKRWDSINNQSFGIETLHGIAKHSGYSEHDFKKQWYRDNPQFSKRKPKSKYKKKRQSKFAQDSDLTLTAEQKSVLFSGDTSDLDYSERLIYLYQNQIRYISDADKWIHYSRGAWHFTDTRNSSIYPLAIRAANAMAVAASDEDERKIASTFRQQKKITAAVILLKGFSDIIIRQKDLDQNPMLLNVANGVIDLETGKLMSASPELLLSKQSPAIYNPNYHSSDFDDFMIQILPDEQTRAAVLRFFGYCLTGDVREEKALFIHGGGGNGKGVLMRSIMKVLADYAVPMNIDALLQHRTEKDGDSPTPEFAKLEGIRMAFANEIPQGKNLDAAHFKDLTGGDSIAIRRLHQESSIIENPTHKLILCGQHLPDLRDSKDIGLQRRLLVAKFTETFTGAKCDPHLKYRLTESDALTGILTVLVNECLAWQRDGLIISEAMTAEKKAYLESNDFITDFIAEFCERGDGKPIARADFLSRLKNAYPQARAIGDRALTEMIDKVEGVSYRRSHGARKFFGVEWKDDPQG